MLNNLDLNKVAFLDFEFSKKDPREVGVVMGDFRLHIKVVKTMHSSIAEKPGLLHVTLDGMAYQLAALLANKTVIHFNGPEATMLEETLNKVNMSCESLNIKTLDIFKYIQKDSKVCSVPSLTDLNTLLGLPPFKAHHPVEDSLATRACTEQYMIDKDNFISKIKQFAYERELASNVNQFNQQITNLIKLNTNAKMDFIKAILSCE